MKTLASIVATLIFPFALFAAKPPVVEPKPEIAVSAIRYEGQLSENEARFTANLDLEVTGKGEAVLPVFEGDVAVLTTKLPTNVRLTREGKQYRVIVERAGRYRLPLELVAKINRAEPWNSVSFIGPIAAIGEVTATAKGAGVDVQLLSGTVQETGAKDGVTKVRGFLGPDRVVSVRWQSRAAEVARQALLTCETTATVQVTPTVVKYKTDLKYEILQGMAARLTLTMPVAQALTKLQGEGVRDWAVKTEGDRQILTVEFIKPVEKNYALTLLSEQSLDNTTTAIDAVPPQPEQVERESGTITVSAEDVQVSAEGTTGLRQVNATGGALVAYQFYARPFTLNLKLRRLEPLVTASDRVTVRVEEARLLVNHALSVNVSRAGIYSLELTPQKGVVVSDVKGDGVEDWKVAEGKLQINFSQRVLGGRNLQVQLERPVSMGGKEAGSLVVEPLRVTSVAQISAQIGAAALPGIQLKTAADGLTGVREIPIDQLPGRTDEILAYRTTGTDWKLTLAAERMAARLTADVFNLITIGDGLLGGSATIRFAILNQGVQEFRVRVPKLWKNVEFTGPNIRRKELDGETWTIGLQEKVWGGYTLVLTYDYQFEPRQATLPLGGIHPEGVERETGSVAITSAANLQLTPDTSGDAIRRVDDTELAGTDRALITRPVLLAYKYTGDRCGLSVDVTRFDEVPVLDAVADRTQLTTVLTEDGQLKTVASFMVKNNDRQFQTVTLPADATLWSYAVNGKVRRGEEAKLQRSGGKYLVPLPRGGNRDEAFAIEIEYVQKVKPLKGLVPHSIALAAPVTDMQTTYAEWELWVPKNYRLASFGGNMTVARGTTYGLRDAWREFIKFYDMLYREGAGLFWAFVALCAFACFVVYAIRRGWRGALAFIAVAVVLLVFAAMLLPALSSSREKARSVQTMSNLKQVGSALALWSEQHGGQLPGSLDELKGIVGDEKVLIDHETGGRFEYDGNGKKWQEAGGNAVLAYSADRNGRRQVLMSNGSVQWMNDSQFGDLVGQVDLDDSGRLSVGGGAIAGKPAPSMKPPPVTSVIPGTVDGTTVAGIVMSERLSGGDARGDLPTSQMVAGIKPLRIELVGTGTRFVFTKVLNVGAEPLAVRATALELKVFNAVRGSTQSLLFAIGLALAWWQWRRATPNILLLALGIALAVGSVVSLLVSFRLLHWAMVLTVPVIGLVAGVWLVRKLWRKREKDEGDTKGTKMDGGNDGTTPPVIPPVVTAIVLVAFAVNANAGGTPITTKPEAVVLTVAAPVVSNAVTLVSAGYTGTVKALEAKDAGRVAQMEAVIELETKQNNARVPLFGSDVAVQEFTATPTTVKLMREDGTVSVQVPRKGKATLKLKFLVKLTGDVARRQLALGIPPALTSRAVVTIDEPGAVVEAPAAVALKTTTEREQTRVEAVFGAADRVEFSWTPRMKRAAEIAATVFCQNASLVTFGGGVVNVRSVLDYQIAQGELRQIRVALPAGQRLMRVEGDAIRTWKVDAQVVNVELVKGMSQSYRLMVETEKVLEMPQGAKVTVETPHAMDVKREAGLLGLWSGEETSLAVEKAEELQKVNVEEFGDVSQATKEETKFSGFGSRSGRPAVVVNYVTSAYRFLKPDYKLIVRVEPVQPVIEAVVSNHVRIGTDQITMRATAEYNIKRAGVFALALAVPDGFTVTGVNGQGVSSWSVTDKRLNVLLQQRTQGAFSLTVNLTQALKELPKSVAVPAVRALDVAKSSGFISVAAEEGVQIKTESFDGVTEVPVTSVAGAPMTGGVLAFKNIPTDGGTVGANWKLTVATERVESWVRAEVLNVLTLSETLVSGRAQVRFEIANAPTREFRLRVPAAFKNVEVSGADIRRKDHDDATGEWRVELQNKVKGNYTLVVTWDLPWKVKDGGLEFSGVEALGVERETGSVAVLAPGRLKVEGKPVNTDLRLVDAQDLPEWAGQLSETPVLVYRYLRPGYRLPIGVQRFEDAQLLPAKVVNARLTTVVSEDGQMMTEMSLALRNSGRQYLEVSLPEKSDMWSAFVAGQPVRPTKRGGKLLLPLERSVGDATVAVEITYVGRGEFPRTRGGVELVTPGLDVPLENAHWDLYLPPDYQYSKFEGTMQPEVKVVTRQQVVPVVSTYSWRDYSYAESKKKAEREKEINEEVAQATDQLSKSNLNEAFQGYNRARQYIGKDVNAKNPDLSKLEKSLKQSQARNLQQGQWEFVGNNAYNINGTANQPQPTIAPNAPAQQAQGWYANADAELQVDKLQKAQEVTVAKAMPLRVNLPKRGAHLSFTQVLQTEGGKPMSVRFKAVEARTVGLPGTIALCACGFAVLWAGLWWLLRRREDSLVSR